MFAAGTTDRFGPFSAQRSTFTFLLHFCVLVVAAPPLNPLRDTSHVHRRATSRVASIDARHTSHAHGIVPLYPMLEERTISKGVFDTIYRALSTDIGYFTNKSAAQAKKAAEIEIPMQA